MRDGSEVVQFVLCSLLADVLKWFAVVFEFGDELTQPIGVAIPELL